MNRTIFHRRRAERFAQLLDEAGGARRHHVRSRLDAQLAELVAIGHQASALRPTVELEPEFRTGLRAMLVATAEREGIGRTARDPEPDATPRAPAQRALSPSRLRTRGAVIIGVAAGAIAVSGMSAASGNAVPGDALYTVKRSTERAQLALASSDLTRGQLYLDFAHTRVAEAAAVRGDRAGFAAVLDDMDADTRHGVRLLTTSAATRRDPAALDAVASFVTMQRLELGGLLDRVSGANRHRTLDSLALLDSVAKRAEAMRTALTCGGSPSAGSDALGPKPRECTAGAEAGDDGRRRAVQNEPPAQGTGTQSRVANGQDRGEKETSAGSGSPAQPTGSGVGADPAAPTRSGGSAGQPAQPAQPATPLVGPDDADRGGEDLLDEVGQVLGDLLG